MMPDGDRDDRPGTRRMVPNPVGTESIGGKPQGQGREVPVTGRRYRFEPSHPPQWDFRCLSRGGPALQPTLRLRAS